MTRTSESPSKSLSQIVQNHKLSHLDVSYGSPQGLSDTSVAHTVGTDSCPAQCRSDNTFSAQICVTHFSPGITRSTATHFSLEGHRAAKRTASHPNFQQPTVRHECIGFFWALIITSDASLGGALVVTLLLPLEQLGQRQTCQPLHSPHTTGFQTYTS